MNALVRRCALGALLLLVGEVAAQEAPVRSHLEGRLSVRAEIDSTQNYAGFEILVANESAAGIDTLGYAETDVEGRFALDVVAPGRGLYPLLISRNGTLIKLDELAVAEGDSAVVEAVLPVGERPLRIRSAENSAWIAFRNTKAQHKNNLVELLQAGTYNDDEIRKRVVQTSLILWSMRETFPGTVGADLAAAEAVMMLGGWDDSLAVARARAIAPENPSYAGVARVARMALARHEGPEAALALVRDFQARAAGEEAHAALQAEIVMAHVEADQRAEALAAARTLAEDYAHTGWVPWAEKAIYELETLMPGLPAPGFEVQTRTFDPLSLEALRGNVVVLEFYQPRSDIFLRELPLRAALFAENEGKAFRLVSISLEPDRVLNEALFEGRSFPGLHVVAPGGAGGPLARLYNINVLPTRYLIDQEGRIVGKYVGGGIETLQRDVQALLSDAG